MKNISILQQQKHQSPLQSLKFMGNKGSQKNNKNLSFTMNLTTLIDAFCILVIFLLSNMNGQLQNLNIGKDIRLPMAEKTEILNTGITLRLEKNQFFIEDKEVNKDQLTENLIKHKTKEKNSLIIQADKNSDFEKLSILLRAGSQAGFEKYAFAVLPGKGN